MAWEPLPTGEGANPLIRRLKAIDAEIYGHIYAQSGTIGGDVTIEGDLTGNDILSSNWVSGGGTYPATSLPDASATTGYYLDASAGSAQFQDLYAEGGELGDLDITGDITLNGGKFATAPTSSARIEISQTGSTGLIQFIDASNVVKNSLSMNTAYSKATFSDNVRFSGDIDVFGDSIFTETMWLPTDDTGSNGAIWGLAEGTAAGEMEFFARDDRHSIDQHGVRFRNTYLAANSSYSQVLLKQNGSVSYPEYSWIGDTNTGMYWYGANEIGFATGTTTPFVISANHIYGPVTLAPAMRSRAGSASTPDYSWVDDLNTGMYRYGANAIGWGIAGNLGMVLSSAKDLFIGTVSDPGYAYIKGSAAGSASTPTYSFTNDPDTGMFRDGANIIGFTCGTTQPLRVRNDYIYDPQTTGNEYRFAIRTDAYSTTYPTYSFANDTNTGMARGSADQIQLICGGGVEMYLSTTQCVIPNVYNDSTTGSADVLVQSNGRIQRTTSAAKYKTNIKTAAWLADTPLRPVEFDSLLDKGVHAYGLIADEVAAALPDAGKYGDDGDVENYDTRAVIAVLVAKVNRLEEEVRELKSGNN